MSDIATVSQKIQEALDAVNALRASLEQLAEKSAVDVPQPPKENNTVSQPDPDATQKVPVVIPHVEQGTYIDKPQGPPLTGGGNFSA